MNNQKASVSLAEGEKFKRKLVELLRKTENCRCADCGAPKPNWASANLGVFICLTCSGIHRSLGVHISQVRSTSLDTWTRQQMQFIQCMDNVKANSYWEANMPPSVRRPSAANRIELENFIRAKYENRKFVGEGPAPTLENFATHPWFQKSDPQQVNAIHNSNLPVPTPTSTQSPTTQNIPTETSVSFDLLSMDGPTPTPNPPQQPSPSNDPFGDFVMPTQPQPQPTPTPSPHSAPATPAATLDTLQDPFQASYNITLQAQEPNHHKSKSAPYDIDQLDGFSFGQFEAATTNNNSNNNNINSITINTPQNNNNNNINKLSTDDIMSLYDKQGVQQSNGGADDDFFVDPKYVQQQQQQQMYQQQQRMGMGMNGAGAGMGGMPHAQSAPNLSGQAYQQQMWMQQQQQQQYQQQQYGGMGQPMNYNGQFNMMNQGGMGAPQNGAQYQQQFY